MGPPTTRSSTWPSTTSTCWASRSRRCGQPQLRDAKTRAWGAVVDEFDGFVFVTPEYDHSIPAAMKNFFDVLGPEWQRKAVAFAAHGADGGVRAVEHWRTTTATTAMPAARSQVPLSLFTDFGEQGFLPADRRGAELEALLDEVETLTGLSRQLRAA